MNKRSQTSPVKVLITGASGFIGSNLISKLSNGHSGAECIGLVRDRNCKKSLDARLIEGDITNPNEKLRVALEEVDVVVHAAGYATNPLIVNKRAESDLLKVNCHATYELARLSKEAGVSRFIFISTAKVFGEEEVLGRAFCLSDIPKPTTLYASSKWMAEQKLSQMKKNCSMEIQIVRPPLVVGYSNEIKDGFGVKLIKLGFPLPFSALTKNSRSYVKIDTLCDGISKMISNELPANSIFCFKEKEDLSTLDLFKLIAAEVGCRLRHFYIPPVIIKTILRVFRLKKIEVTLFKSFRIVS